MFPALVDTTCFLVDICDVPRVQFWPVDHLPESSWQHRYHTFGRVEMHHDDLISEHGAARRQIRVRARLAVRFRGDGQVVKSVEMMLDSDLRSAHG